MDNSTAAKVLLAGGCSTCKYYYQSNAFITVENEDGTTDPVDVELCRYDDVMSGSGYAYPFDSLPQKGYCEKWRKK